MPTHIAVVRIGVATATAIGAAGAGICVLKACPGPTPIGTVTWYWVPSGPWMEIVSPPLLVGGVVTCIVIIVLAEATIGIPETTGSVGLNDEPATPPGTPAPSPGAMMRAR